MSNNYGDEKKNKGMPMWVFIVGGVFVLALARAIIKAASV